MTLTPLVIPTLFFFLVNLLTKGSGILSINSFLCLSPILSACFVGQFNECLLIILYFSSYLNMHRHSSLLFFFFFFFFSRLFSCPSSQEKVVCLSKIQKGNNPDSERKQGAIESSKARRKEGKKERRKDEESIVFSIIFSSFSSHLALAVSHRFLSKKEYLYQLFV